MDELCNTIANLASTLHRDRVDSIAAIIEEMKAPSDFAKRIPAFGIGYDPTLIELGHAWSACRTVSSREIAFALRAASHTATAVGNEQSIDLVWTGPSTSLIPTRKTEQVMCEIVEQSKQNLFIVSYVFYNASRIVDSLNDAANRNVTIRILLESHSGDGGSVTLDGFGAMRQSVPSAELFTWNVSKKTKSAQSLAAAVHAKCAVADHRLAFITSANLTSAALERNMELGVFFRGGTIPARLHAHLDALVSTSIVKRHTA